MSDDIDINPRIIEAIQAAPNGPLKYQKMAAEILSKPSAPDEYVREVLENPRGLPAESLAANPNYEHLITKMMTVANDSAMAQRAIINGAMKNPGLTASTVKHLTLSPNTDFNMRKELLDAPIVQSDDQLFNDLVSTHLGIHPYPPKSAVDRFDRLSPQNRTTVLVHGNREIKSILSEKHPEAVKDTVDHMAQAAENGDFQLNINLRSFAHRHPELVTEKAARHLAKQLQPYETDDYSRDIKWPEDLVESLIQNRPDTTGYFLNAKNTPKKTLENLVNSSNIANATQAAVRLSPDHVKRVFARVADSPRYGEDNQRFRSALFHSEVGRKYYHNVTPELLHDMLGKPGEYPDVSVPRHPSATVDLSAEAMRRLVELKHSDSMAAEHVPHDLVSIFNSSPSDERHVQHLLSGLSYKDFNSQLPRSDWEDAKNKLLASASKEQLPQIDQWQVDSGGVADNSERYNKLFPTESRPAVSFAINTNRIRKARHLAAKNGGSIHEDELKRQGLDLRANGHAKVFDGKGYMSVDSATKYIDKLPKVTYHVDFGEYDGEWQRHDKHQDKPQTVFQLVMTPEQKKELYRKNLWPTYKDMYDKVSRGHPLAPNGGIGWVRFTSGFDQQPHIDEIQTDFHTGSGNFSDYGPSEKTQWKKIEKTLFHGKNPTDLFHEAFHQHLRDTGRITDEQPMKTHIFDVKAKQTDLGGLNADRPPPVHAVNTYNSFPSKIGYQPDTYGTAETQSNPQWKGQPTHSMDVYKSEIANWLELHGLAKSASFPNKYNEYLRYYEAPVKAQLGDMYAYPEFRAAKMLAPYARFDEDAYREALRLHGDDPIWAAIFAYGLPRLERTKQEIEQLCRLYV